MPHILNIDDFTKKQYCLMYSFPLERRRLRICIMAADRDQTRLISQHPDYGPAQRRTLPACNSADVDGRAFFRQNVAAQTFCLALFDAVRGRAARLLLHHSA